MLQRFKENCLDSNPDLYQNNWRLFVRTMNYDENDYRLDTYTLIDHNMPFLSIPEYVMNNNCLLICTNIHTRIQSTMGQERDNVVYWKYNRKIMNDLHGKMSSVVATQEYLVVSANITAVSQTEYFRKQVTKSIHNLNSAKKKSFRLDFSDSEKIKAISICEYTLANNEQLCGTYTVEAMKHQNTQENSALVDI